MTPQLLFDPHQRFACRDCPARCCKNWSITASATEMENLLRLDWVRERLATFGAEPKPLPSSHGTTYRLPMRARGRELVCVFLDDDDLCSVHRREGHEKLPAICQSFPFSFVQEKTGVVHASLSTYCPSIRDNYGEPLASQIETKFSQASPFTIRLPDTLALGPHQVPQETFLRLGDFWLDILGAETPLAYALGAIRDHLTILQDSLGPSPSATTQPVSWADAGWEETTKLMPDLLHQQAQRLGHYQPETFPFPTRAMLGSLLIALCDPTFRAIVQPRPYRFLPSIVRNILGLATGRLPLRMEGIDRPVRFHQAAWQVEGPQPEHESLIRAALTGGLRSRLHFARADSLPEVVLLLAAGLAIIHLYARLRASALERRAVNEADVREAVAIADKVCLRHGNLLRVLPASRALWGMLANLPNAHERFLAACLPDSRAKDGTVVSRKN
ncbi:MAG: hypothetical protein OHK005_18370 [Candidatus Methylacidiphilales bacterium]